MEIQERNGFSIVGFIAQVLIILLFVFVLMWLFPTKSYLENNGTTNSTGSNSALAEMLFNQNLLSMKDAAREYFTVKRMPAANGNSKTLKLGDMINSSMVVEFIDANGNKCDREASYVKVTKVDSEYEMEVSLTCGKITKKIITTVGCYNYCESGMCEKENTQVTLYQYAKKVAATSGWSKWSEWSKTAVTKNSKRQVETKVVKEKTGTTIKQVDATKTTTYTCKEGTLSGKKCIIGVTGTKTVDAKANTTYSCKEGTLNGTKCTITITGTKTVDAKANTTYTCKEGTLNGTKCVITDVINAIPHVKVSFSCVEGVCKSESKIDYYYCKDTTYKVVGKTCQKSRTVDATATTKYSCENGKLDGNKCVIPTTSTKTVNATATTKYSCSEGTLKDNKCIVPTSGTKTVDATANNTYACTTGKLNGTKCDITEDVYSNVTYYRYRTYTTTAAKTIYKWSSSSNDQKLIKAGYKYTGVTKTSTSK